jgi:uncharacterized protein
MGSLVIELSSISHEGISRHFRSTVATLGIDNLDVSIAQPLDIDCQFVKVDRDVVVHGTLRSVARLSCSRCDEEFMSPLTLALDAIYLPIVDFSPERAEELENDLTDIYSYGESGLDLGEMLRDKLLLSIPLQPHCTADCKGLCPSCGANRNTVQCQCAEAKLRSPFELLKELRFS